MLKKQYCPKGHDTFIVGRRKNGSCKQCSRDIHKRWTESNLDKSRAIKRRWYRANLERANAASKRWREANPYKRRAQQFKRHGISEETFLRLLQTQDNRCANIGCRVSIDVYTARIDHDHNCCSCAFSCGKCIRGLLCQNCNVMLGAAKDNLERLSGGIKYLVTYGKIVEAGFNAAA